MAGSPKTCGEVNPELAEEREKCTFRVTELTNLLDGGSSSTASRREIEQKFAEDSRFARYVEFSGLSKDDYYRKTVDASMHFQRKLEELDLAMQIPGDLQFVRSAHICSIAMPCDDPLVVHPFMFIPTIMNQGTEEQQAKWIPLARKYVILGTYSQTELGHGTNMKGLETTATYDPKTEEFVLHSPTLSSIKFWPGGLGRSCNATIVIAQLYTKGVCHGVHPFYLQLRSLEDHKPLPGITVGELGPKLGMNAYDNGFLKLDHVRIPRTNMLMKRIQVLPDGTYVKSKKPLAGYGTLILARTVVMLETTLRLAQAATIAVRYSAVRRQGGSSNPGEIEMKIIDYQTLQYNLFPQVAMAYAGFFASRLCYNKMMEFLANPSSSVAAEVHALTSGLKALCSQNAGSGVELCRLSCGGLGYLDASRLPHLYGYTTASCTYDGENTVLFLQTAKYLIKSYHAAKNGEELPFPVQYLNLNWKGNKDHQSDALSSKLHRFQKTTRNLVSDVATRLQTSESSNTTKTSEDPWNRQMVDLVKCARFHVQIILLEASSSFVLTEADISESLKAVLRRLFELLALLWIRQSAGDFMRFGGMSSSDVHSCDSRLFDLLDELRPDIVGLVDAFDFRDESLQSVIGSYDGRVYERVYEYLMKLHSNKSQLNSSQEKSKL